MGKQAVWPHILNLLRQTWEDDEDVTLAFSLVYRYTIGYVAFELPRSRETTSSDPECDRLAPLSAIARQRNFVNLERVASRLSMALAGEQFEVGVIAILAGLRLRSSNGVTSVPGETV